MELYVIISIVTLVITLVTKSHDPLSRLTHRNLFFSRVPVKSFFGVCNMNLHKSSFGRLRQARAEILLPLSFLRLVVYSLQVLAPTNLTVENT